MPSYKALLKKPAWWLYDDQGKIVASIRAKDADTAREKFIKAGLTGKWIKKGTDD